MRKFFTLAAAVLASFSLWAAEPTLTLTANGSAIADWNKTYDNVTVSVVGAGLASKRPCGVSTNEDALSLSSADSHWLEISCPDGLSKVVIRGSGNSSGTTDWAAPLCVCSVAPFDSTITSIIEVHYTGYDKACVDSEIDLPEGTKSVRLYRRMKVNADGTTVGSGSNWAPASATGNQTFNISYVEVYAGGAAPSTDPVETAEISGENACVLGSSVELTCTAAKATDYQWYLDEVAIDGATAKTYTFTPAAAGVFSFTCAASNENNLTPIVSAAHVVTVSDPADACGELIKATRNGKNLDPVTGAVGGSAEKKTQDNGKLGSNGHYWKLTLASGNFMVGDTVVITTSAAAQQGELRITSDQEGTDVLGNGGLGAVGDNEIVLTKGGVQTIWMVRIDASNKWNGVIDAISVRRSCEDSDNNNAAVSINGENVEPEGTVFNYTLSKNYAEPTVAVVITLEHPAATLMDGHAASFTMLTPEPGEQTVETFKVKAENGDEAWYSIFVKKSASLSTDATLKELTVAGYTLTPAFSADVEEYAFTRPYEKANPAVSAITATPTDANAKSVQIDSLGTSYVITVTAEDETTTKAYTININIAEAVKKINKLVLSNGYQAYIPAGDESNIYGFYLEGEEEPYIVDYLTNEGTILESNGNTVILTGADNTTAELTLNLASVAPVEFTEEKIVFNGTETWVKSGYGWDNTKKWKFSKTDTDYSREIAGKTHIEMFLPACDTVILTEAGVESRDIYVYANGHQIGDKVKLEKNKDLAIVVKQASAFMLTIESAQNGGDGGVGAIRLAKAKTSLTTITDVALTVVFPEAGDSILHGSLMWYAEENIPMQITSGDPDAYYCQGVDFWVGNYDAYPEEALLPNKTYRVRFYVYPKDGYTIPNDLTIDHVKVNGEQPEDDVDTDVWEDRLMFSVFFTTGNATGLEEIDATAKAVKVIYNGQLLIKRGDVFYNAQGAIVK